MHPALVFAGWWTALSVCAVPAWVLLMRRGSRRAKPTGVGPVQGAEPSDTTEQSA